MGAPAHGAGEFEWRKWAGHLEHLLGKERAKVERAEASLATMKAALADAKTQKREFHNQARSAQSKEAKALGRCVTAWERLDELRGKYSRLKFSKERDVDNLDQLEELLDEGNTPAAVDLLAERRAAIEEAQARREASA